MSCLMINDIDAGLGRFGKLYYLYLGVQIYTCWLFFLSVSIKHLFCLNHCISFCSLFNQEINTVIKEIVSFPVKVTLK